MIFDTKRVLLTVLTAIAPSALPWGLAPIQAAARVDPDKIYYGDARKYSHPAVVDAAKVYAQIPAHQEIVSRKLTRNDPDYWPLMRKASQVFVRALKKVCQTKGYDLVGEAKTIAAEGARVPEITDDVIGAIEKPRSEGKGSSGRNGNVARAESDKDR
jgi:hypothetical protein